MIPGNFLEDNLYMTPAPSLFSHTTGGYTEAREYLVRLGQEEDHLDQLDGWSLVSLANTKVEKGDL